MKQWMFFQSLITSINNNRLGIKVDSSRGNFGLFKDSNKKKKPNSRHQPRPQTGVSTSFETQSQSNALDEWLDKRIELIENLATSPRTYKKLIRIEWFTVFGLSAWLMMVFTTILN